MEPTFAPMQEKDHAPVWSKPPDPPSTVYRPWQANLPSYYTQWSPTSTRKLAKPAANWAPTGQPEDPKPNHFNRPIPSHSPAIYRRVMFRPISPANREIHDENNQLRIEAQSDNTHMINADHTNTGGHTNVNNHSNGETSDSCQSSNDLLQTSIVNDSSLTSNVEDKTNGHIGSLKIGQVTGESPPFISDNPSQPCVVDNVPNIGAQISSVDSDAQSQTSVKSPTCEFSAEQKDTENIMVSMPSNPVPRTDVCSKPNSNASVASNEPPLPYQNVPWRSPQSNRKMFAKLKSPSLSIEEIEHDSSSKVSSTSHKVSTFMMKRESGSSNSNNTVGGENVFIGGHHLQTNASSTNQNTPVVQEQNIGSNESEKIAVISDETCHHIATDSVVSPGVMQPNDDSVSQSMTERTIESAEQTFSINPIENNSNYIDVTQQNDLQDVTTQPGSINEPTASLLASDNALNSTEVIKSESEEVVTSTSVNEKSNIQIDQSETEVKFDIEQPPPPPPPPARDCLAAKPPKGNPIQELLANVVRYESVEEAREKTNLQSDAENQQTSAMREPSPEYQQTPVTSRIQKFEKQASFEKEAPKIVPSVKPVGPWVKKTSSGPVQSLEEWNGKELNLCSNATNELSTTEYIPPSKSVVRRTDNEENNNSLFSSSTKVESKSYSDINQSTKQARASFLSKMSKMPTPSSAVTDPPATLKKDDPVFDPWCDPVNPRVIQFQDVSAAAFKIKSGIINTPCTYSNMSANIGSEIFFKKEFNQYTGSFKERGARYALLCLSEDQRKKGVIAASAGNHALALSYHGKDLGIPVTVVMPIIAPIMKVEACRQYGANVIVTGYDIGECKEIALKKAKDQDLLYLNGYDHPHILAGQGTMGLEIVEQVPNIDAVVVPVGGGGLIAGVAMAVKSLYPNVKVIGVEAQNCPSFTAAMKANKPVKIEAESTLADGLAVPCVGTNAFATAQKLIDKVVTVREEWIAIAILRLVEMEKAVVEGAGATGLAALLAGELPELKGKRVVIPLCGGNIDTTILGRCLDRGLAADGRLVKFTVTVSDRPGGIAELTRLLANLGVSIKDMLHERAWIRNDIFSVEVKVLCETRNQEHSDELLQVLQKNYPVLRFGTPQSNCRVSKTMHGIVLANQYVKVVCETKGYDHFILLKTELEKKYQRIRFPLPKQIAHTK